MKNNPFLLKPIGKDYLWGGTRLNDDFTKKIDLNPLAETWECSTHPDGLSIVNSGEYSGKTLKQVLKENPNYLGRHANNEGELPILIKFIDAKNDLSVQVHPTDEYAKKNENGQLGKTEMWYVLDATEYAKLIYGLNRDVDKKTITDAIKNGTIEKYLQKVKVKKGDLFFIDSGTIHAIGAGSLIAEIQENSNLTYRLYDYNRFDKNGNKRELHIDKAVEVANLNSSLEPVQPLRVLKYKPGMASELLCQCKYFQVYRMLINTERRQIIKYQSDDISYRVLLCIDGSGIISYEDTYAIKFYKGDCIFVPASSVELFIDGQAEFLDIRG